jgi:hypothetical protein
MSKTLLEECNEKLREKFGTDIAQDGALSELVNTIEDYIKEKIADERTRNY